jgi:hypothetical protein
MTQLPRQMSVHYGRTLKMKSGFQVQFRCHLQLYEPEAKAIRIIHKHCPVHASEIKIRAGGDEVFSNSESSYPDQRLANERAYLSENGHQVFRRNLVVQVGYDELCS